VRFEGHLLQEKFRAFFRGSFVPATVPTLEKEVWKKRLKKHKDANLPDEWMVGG
jgi:hypothetical protein